MFPPHNVGNTTNVTKANDDRKQANYLEFRATYEFSNRADRFVHTVIIALLSRDQSSNSRVEALGASGQGVGPGRRPESIDVSGELLQVGLDPVKPFVIRYQQASPLISA
jgi:hypothetical protein